MRDTRLTPFRRAMDRRATWDTPPTQTPRATAIRAARFTRLSPVPAMTILRTPIRGIAPSRIGRLWPGMANLQAEFSPSSKPLVRCERNDRLRKGLADGRHSIAREPTDSAEQHRLSLAESLSRRNLRHGAVGRSLAIKIVDLVQCSSRAVRAGDEIRRFDY
jgi:hypothetical protein